MRGSIRQRKNGSWELRVSVGRDALTGKYLYVSRTATGGKRDAQRALGQLIVELGETRGVVASRITVTELVEKHLERFEGSPSTLRGYQQVLDAYIRPTIGNLPITEVGPAILDEFYERLGAERQLAPATVRRVHAVMRGAFARAVKWKWIASNPARDASPPTVRRKDINLPTSAQIAAAVTEADRRDPTFGVFVRLAAATGARRGELCALRWRAINFDTGSVFIEHAAITTAGGGVLIKDTKNHSRRRVLIDPATTGALKAHLGAMTARAQDAGTKLAADAFVFSHDDDGANPWYVDNITHNWDRVRKAVGLDGVRLHDLRHFQATMLLQAGVPVPNVSKRIGHRDSATTLNVYSHFIEETDAESARVMARVLDGEPAAPRSPSKRFVRAPKKT